MVLTTTNSIEGFRIIEYKGIVTGISYNSGYSHKGRKMSFKDMFNMKKYYEAYEAGLQSIKEEAFQKLCDNAKALNANAVVGIKVDIEPLSQSATLIISVTGTAVSVATDK
ncbi:heavy metal-binding domain-containing protein [uncultured Lacinutrix sp.]|uniref:YbjQ family protein n=1 Tax=uncultured Lacinutrix sp. TaxID=574032 RepID=UPI00260C22F9|nr:heavy metal-binding domain-containing protein [uncultured Lacinutrix sp.]